MLVLNSQLGDKLVISKTDEMLASVEPPQVGGVKDVKWETCKGTEFKDGLRVRITHTKVVLA